MSKSKNLNPFEGFSRLKFDERAKLLKCEANLSDEDLATLHGRSSGLSLDQAEMFVENLIGVFQLPLGLATNLVIDGIEKVVPMAVEETSIIAAASSASKWVKRNGGFKTQVLGKNIIGQIQFPKIKNLNKFVKKINENSSELIHLANEVVPGLVARGGGVIGLQIRTIDRPDSGKMAVLHILCDPCDAMGANLINQVCEALKSPLEKLTQEKIGLCILSNLTDTKIVEAKCEISDINPELGRAIEEATLFANLDPYRCATHNKGVMNGIDPILIATGNDWRAVEAGVHAYNAIKNPNKKYQSITEWKMDRGTLKGRICIPMSIGTVGGVTQIHPVSKVALKIMNVKKSEDLARICAAMGLAQNLAALRALCSEGIVKGHMRLHFSNLALMAGATKEETRIMQLMIREDEPISLARTKSLLVELRKNS